MNDFILLYTCYKCNDKYNNLSNNILSERKYIINKIYNFDDNIIDNILNFLYNIKICKRCKLSYVSPTYIIIDTKESKNNWIKIKNICIKYIKIFMVFLYILLLLYSFLILIYMVITSIIYKNRK